MMDRESQVRLDRRKFREFRAVPAVLDRHAALGLPARLRRSDTPCEPEPWRRRTFDVRPIDADDRIEFPDLCHFGRDMRQSCEICE